VTSARFIPAYLPPIPKKLQAGGTFRADFSHWQSGTDENCRFGGL
jgi:hypothetical protein